MHTSVFLKEAVDALHIEAGSQYIDATYGQGGHARLIEERGGIVLGIDADPEQAAQETTIRVVQGNFADIAEIAKREAFHPVQGILFDFGLSMEQLRTSGRGFSYQKDKEPLDMRLDQHGMTAANYLATANETELIESLMKYSEDLLSEQIAKHIARKGGVETVGDLKQAIDDVIAHQEHQPPREQTYARIFQAMRIIVNDELENVQKGLEGAMDILSLGGRIVTISFHSLEDRVVKSFARVHAGSVKHERLSVSKDRPLQKFERSATLRVITKYL